MLESFHVTQELLMRPSLGALFFLNLWCKRALRELKLISCKLLTALLFNPLQPFDLPLGKAVIVILLVLKFTLESSSEIRTYNTLKLIQVMW
jgi:hypothetical protein